MTLVSILTAILGIAGTITGVIILTWRHNKRRQPMTANQAGTVPAYATALGRGVGFLGSGIIIVIIAVTGIVH